MTESLYKEKKEEVKLTEVVAGEAPALEIRVAAESAPFAAESASLAAQAESSTHDDSQASAPDKPADVAATSKFSETPPDLGPRYDILGLVGTGGMGTVWKVHDKELGEDFAIKVLKPELVTDETALKRFQKEANLASELTHANIAAIFGPGEDGSGRPYIIMRYVDGESLADILKREGKLSEERAMDIFAQLCEALSHSHMKGIVHRDIKPSNIIISKTESGADLVQLVDFGIARCVYDEVTKTQALTKAVDVFGSPRYMSPEQLLGQEVSPQSDIYSLGIVMYEMLTGEPPFKAENPVELFVQQINDKADLTKVPPNMRLMLSACLHKLASARPTSVDTALQLSNSAFVHTHNPYDLETTFSYLYFLVCTAIVAALTNQTLFNVITPLLVLVGMIILSPTFIWLSLKYDVIIRNELHIQRAGKVLTFAATLIVLGLFMSLVTTSSIGFQIDRSLISTISSIFSAIVFVILGHWLKTTKNSFSFLLKLCNPNYEVLSKQKKSKQAVRTVMTTITAVSISMIAILPLCLAVLYGFWLDSIFVSFNPQFIHPFNQINNTLGLGLVYLLFATACSAAARPLKYASEQLAKAVPSVRTQLLVFVGVIAASCIGSGIFLSLNASTGIFDYLKTSLADHTARKQDRRVTVPIPSQVDSYYGAIAMVELPPFSTAAPISQQESDSLNKVLNSNLDPLLKAQVIASAVGNGLRTNDLSRETRILFYSQRKPLIERSLELLAAAPDKPEKLPANIKATETWIRLAMQQHPKVSKEESLRAFASAAAQNRDIETLKKTLEQIKALKARHPDDRAINRVLPAPLIDRLESIVNNSEPVDEERPVN